MHFIEAKFYNQFRIWKSLNQKLKKIKKYVPSSVKKLFTSNVQHQQSIQYQFISYSSNNATIEHYYEKPYQPCHEKYIKKINYWLQSKNQDNYPLVFRTLPGCGIKTLLINWQKANNQIQANKKQKILTIMHFTSNGGEHKNYFYSLYHILIKLRQHLKLKQHVDLLQQNIRNFFSYWLDLCSCEVEKQLIICCSQQIYHKIVLVIEGVDEFIDQDNYKQANIAFWLPQKFPKNVKVILTANKYSESIRNLEKRKCQIIDIKCQQKIVNFMIKSTSRKQTILRKSIEQQYKQILRQYCTNFKMSNNIYTYIEVYSNLLLYQNDSLLKNQEIKKILENPSNIKKLYQVRSLKQLYNFILDLWIENSQLGIKIQTIFVYLCLTHKGLTAIQILNLVHIDLKQWQYFLMLFSPVLITHHSIFAIKSNSFIETIFCRIKSTSSANPDHIKLSYHEKIAQILESTPNSIRKLEQQTYHLFVTNSYFKLKQTVSNIENFLLLFNPNNKYQLSRYWQKLQEKGFDPVIEYNKAFQGFTMHYHPSDQDIFRIIVQISRFLKEFSDFETYKTPNFKHPEIEGNLVELQKIGLLKQLASLDIYIDNSYKNDQIEPLQQLSLEDQIQEIRNKYFPKQDCNTLNMTYSKFVAGGQEKNIKRNCNSNMSTNKNILTSPTYNLRKYKKQNKTKINSQIQQLNVDVPMNRDKFRSLYLQILNPFIEQISQINTHASKSRQEYFDVADNQQQTQPQLNNTNLLDINYQSFQNICDNYRMRTIKPTQYYYKRWIWIQFPWVCISLNNNYSNTPELCEKIEQYDTDTVEQQAKYTKQALMVVIQARQRKKKMLCKKENENFRATKPVIQHKVNSFTINKNSAPMKIAGLRTSQLMINSAMDMSLHNLTKDLQLRRKRLKISNVQIQPKSEFFLSEINDNCQQDIQYIKNRQHFHSPNLQNIGCNQLLPKLKSAIKQHTDYELGYINSYIEEKKKKLNKIIYNNKKLQKIYQELRVKQNINKKHCFEQSEGQRNSKKNKILEKLQMKKQEATMQFCRSLLQKQRLKIILKLCSENKTKNQEELSTMNYSLQNFKKMIGFQNIHIKNISEKLGKIRAINEKKKQMQSQQRKNQLIIRKQASSYLSQKQKLQNKIEEITLVIAEDLSCQKDRLENNLTGQLKCHEQKNIILQQEKKVKQLQDKLHKLQSQEKQLKELFNISSLDFQNNQGFQNKIRLNEQNKKLKILYFQRKNYYSMLSKEMKSVREQNQKQAQNQKKKIKSTLKESNKVQHKSQQLQSQQDKLTIILNNISLRIGIQNRQELSSTILEKLNSMKIHNFEQYHKLTSNNV